MHTGYDSRDLARATIEAFEQCDFVVANAAGCGSSMKDYAHLLRDDPQWAQRAERFCAKVRDVTELLAEAGARATRHPVRQKVAYHDACHLAHAQAVRAQPRELLAEIPELELVEPQGWEICCGSAGIYNLLNPGPAAELGDRKAANVLATGAELLVTANPGCLMQVAAALRRNGGHIALAHTVEVLDASLRGHSIKELTDN